HPPFPYTTLFRSHDVASPKAFPSIARSELRQEGVGRGSGPGRLHFWSPRSARRHGVGAEVDEPDEASAIPAPVFALTIGVIGVDEEARDWAIVVRNEPAAELEMIDHVPRH